MRNYYKQYLLLFFAVFTTNMVFSQVGIGNTDPKATLDVTAKYPTGTANAATVDGLTIPSVTRERAQSMTAANIPNSTLIYINEVATGTATLTTEYVTAVGIYSYDSAVSKWKSFSTSGQSSTTYFTTGGISIGSLSGLTFATGFPVTVNIPANCQVLVTCDIGLQTASNNSNGFSITDVLLMVDGAPLTNAGYQRIYTTNNGGVTFNARYATFNQAFTLTPGNHTFGVAAGGAGLGGSAATVGGNNTSVLQGELTVTIIKR